MSKGKASKAEIKKQIEYYLSDKNLESDTFFREKITASEAGYVDLKLFLNCNKVKNMGIDVAEIVDACADSETVQISKDKKMIRRMKNQELPPKVEKGKKRDAKAQAKDGQKGENPEDKQNGTGGQDDEEVEAV